MSNARQIATDVLIDLHHSNRTLDYLLNRADPLFQALQRSDRALAHALIFGVLRWQGRLDWIIGQLLQRPKKRIDQLVHIVLRLGLFQLLYLDRIPASAAVHTSVELVKRNNRKWATGFVNGVLREAVRRAEAITMPDIGMEPVKGLAIRYAFPTWMISRWIGRWGLEETQSLCRAINQIPHITVRTNTLKTTRLELIDAIGHEARSVMSTQFSPVGIRFRSPNRSMARWQAYRNGWFQVQDEAAQIISYLLAPLPGQRVWDTCAGLGTKSAHLAQLMQDKGFLLVSDQEATKLEKLSAEMYRLSVTCVETRCLDLEKPDQLKELALFDRILVDAPCSGLGVLQKNPDGKWRTTAADIKACAQRQLNILTNVSKYLHPDGIMIYAVCSTEPEENELLVRSFLQKHPEFVIHFPDISSVTDANKLLAPEGFLQTLPHNNKMDGFFAAAFKRRSLP